MTQSTQGQAARKEKRGVFRSPRRYYVIDGQDAPPLTVGQKYQVALHSSVDPFTFVATGFTALIGQAADTHSGYGQGMEGYGKRFGAKFADNFSGTFFSKAFFPSILHQDPRYFRMGESQTFKRRALYAISTIVRTRTDSGRRTWSYSTVLGNIAAGGVSNAYYPDEDRGIGLTFENAAIVTGVAGGDALGSEFFPDLKRKLFHHKQPQGTSATEPAPPHP